MTSDNAPAETGVWDPQAARAILEQPEIDALVVELCSALHETRQGFTLEADALDPDRLGRAMRTAHAVWATHARSGETDALVQLVRALVLVEVHVPGCEAGERSPAIVIARELRGRQAWPAGLTAWIRAVSTNRFLPYGSLLDRLG